MIKYFFSDTSLFYHVDTIRMWKIHANSVRMETRNKAEDVWRDYRRGSISWGKFLKLIYAGGICKYFVTKLINTLLSSFGHP